MGGVLDVELWGREWAGGVLDVELRRREWRDTIGPVFRVILTISFPSSSTKLSSTEKWIRFP